MAFSPARLVCRRLLSSLAHTHRRRLSTATAPIESLISPPKIPQKIISSSPPWLMLPPTYNDGDIGYNFYSLAENRVLTRPQTTGLSGLMPNPTHEDLIFCGSSKGWITLFNPDTLDLFLYNPISLRFIQLPPIPNLPNIPKDYYRSPEKVILSGSPDEDDCIALMTYHCVSALAFCRPGRSNEWAPIGNTSYEDIAYSSRRNQFFALNKNRELETWDLSDPLSPRMIKTINTNDNKYIDSTPRKDRALLPKDLCWAIDYLVVADELFSEAEDDLLFVTRYVMEQVAPDGSYIDSSHSDLHPHVTIGFRVLVFNQEDENFYGVDTLGDTSLFIGSLAESVALSATIFTELKENSIYFTDPITRGLVENTLELFGGHDIGIFNYENKTVSPCYYPSDLKKIKRVPPSPMWFFPTGLVWFDFRDSDFHICLQQFFILKFFH